MELSYSGKKSEKEILASVKKIRPFYTDTEKSYFFKGDNIRVLKSLIGGGAAGIDLIYIDPPFNTNQIFTTTKSRTSTISRNNTGTIAYSDTMSFDEYLEFIRQRLILLRELMSEHGSIYFHIDDKSGHYIKILMDEVFGRKNFKNDISRIKSNPKNFMRSAYGNQKDMILFYAKNHKKNIFNNIGIQLTEEEKARMFGKTDSDGRRYNTIPAHAPGETENGVTGGAWKGIFPPPGRHWRCDPKILDELDKQRKIEWSKNGVPRIKKYADEHNGKKIQDTWEYKDPAYPVYPTEKNIEMIKLIIAQSSLENSVVLDCFAGSGTTLEAAETLNRRWIGIDNSESAVKTVKKRMCKSRYEYIDFESVNRN